MYRNIPTCHPRQDLYDDLTDQSAELDELVQATSGIHHKDVNIQRPFQYGNLDDVLLRIFQREGWRAGRFGDGQTYGVWYSAEEEETSVDEACYWAYRLGLDNILSHGEVYPSDRDMYRAEIKASHGVDLLASGESLSGLVHPRDYSHCQELGSRAVREGVQALRSPSARRVGGNCLPVFDALAIQEASFTYSLHISVKPDGFIAVHSLDGSWSRSLKAADLEDPYRAA